jgi:hypothetical protein
VNLDAADQTAVRCVLCGRALNGHELCRSCTLATTPTRTHWINARYDCSRVYKLTVTPVNVLLAMFAVAFAIGVVIAPAQEATATQPAMEDDPFFEVVLGLVLLIPCLAVAGRQLFGRAITLTTDGDELRWRAPLFAGRCSVHDIEAVRADRKCLGQGLAGYIGSRRHAARNHKVYLRDRLLPLHVRTGPGFRSFVELLSELNPYLQVDLAEGLGTGLVKFEHGFSCEEIPVEPEETRTQPEPPAQVPATTASERATFLPVVYAARHRVLEAHRRWRSGSGDAEAAEGMSQGATLS